MSPSQQHLDRLHQQQQQKSAASDVPPVPKIRVRISYAVAALLEKDELITKLGGESTRTLALETMRANATNFFSAKFTLLTKDKNQIETFHKQVRFTPVRTYGLVRN